MKTIHLTKKVAATAVLAIGCIGAAQAEGWYVGANVGTPEYKTSVNGINGDGRGVGGKVYGGYKLTPNFAIEGGVFDLGHIDNASGTVKVRGVFVDGVGAYEFAPSWSVLGRIGVGHARLSTTNGNDSSPAVRLGAGVEYAFTQTVAMRAEYAHYRFSSAFADTAKIGEFTLGVKVAF